MKVARHEKIIELIHQYEIDTQEELASRLNEAGFKVTQATVSRDIRALKLTKVAGKDGRSRYAIINISFSKLPVSIAFNEFFIILGLVFNGYLLIFGICTYTSVKSNS